jgi:hypothetical protein
VCVDLDFVRPHGAAPPLASQEQERSQEREHDRAAVPCSASTPPAEGMFFARTAGNIFTRLAGLRGGGL